MERKNSNVVLHVRQDSENELERLFTHVINPVKVEQSSNSLPMRMRKLPPSFFKQPPLDGKSTLGPPDPSEGGLTISHSRTRSSPASFSAVRNANTSRGPPFGNDAFDESTPLPPGWEMRTTPSGQRYFMNHFEQITTWLDPRKTRSNPNLANIPLTGNLPDGWEQAISPEGDIYYINHLTRTTSWVDPRLAMAQCGGNSANQQQNQLPNRNPPPQPQGPNPQTALHQLQREKEILMKRQQEILQQEIMLKRGMLDGDGSQSSLLGKLSREAFMGHTAQQQESAPTNIHTREGSFDSGLGMSYNNYNHDVDMNHDQKLFPDANSNSKDILCRNNENRSRFPDFLDTMPGTNVDVGITDQNENSTTAMETDDLGVGLDINSEILNEIRDVESVLSPNMSKMDSFLTWL